MRDEIERLRQRTKDFALRVIRLCTSMPDGKVAAHIGFQAMRAGTSVAAQYREACRARSDAELISKLESTLQELDESSLWFELLVDAKIVTQKQLASLMKEADELTAMLVTSVKHVKSRRR